MNKYSCQLTVVPDHDYPPDSLQQKCLQALEKPDEAHRPFFGNGWDCYTSLDCGCLIKARMQELSLSETIKKHTPGALLIFINPCPEHKKLFT